LKKELFIAGVVAFIGIVIILAALGVAPPDPLLISGYICSGIGVALLSYALFSESVKFYLAWGSVFLLLGLSLVFRKEINPLVFLGVLLIALAAIGVAPIRKKS